MGANQGCTGIVLDLVLEHRCVVFLENISRVEANIVALTGLVALIQQVLCSMKTTLFWAKHLSLTFLMISALQGWTKAMPSLLTSTTLMVSLSLIQTMHEAQFCQLVMLISIWVLVKCMVEIKRAVAPGNMTSTAVLITRLQSSLQTASKIRLAYPTMSVTPP